MDKNTDWNTRASRIFCIVCYAAAGVAFTKYLLPPLAPLLFAFVLSFGISTLAKRLSRSTGIPAGVWAFIIVSSLVAAFMFAVYFLLRALLGEISRLLPMLAEKEQMLESVFSVFEGVEMFEYIGEQLTPIAESALSSLASRLGGVLSAALKGTPRALVGALAALMCIYYMSVDFDTVWGFIKRILPRSATRITAKYKSGVLSAAMGYLRAYALLFCLTYVEVAAGLLLLCPSYALIGALAVAIVDILPVFGAGFVLIPWGICEIVTGDIFTGAGLLVLYVTVSIVRRMAEPKIIGKHMGIHPLGALICMYVGYRFFGVAGMLIAPFVVSVAIGAVRSREQSEVNK